MKNKGLFLLLIVTSLACSLSAGGQTATPTVVPVSTLTSVSATETSTAVPDTATVTLTPTFTPTLTATFTPLSTASITLTPRPVAESLKARVTAERLSCRYGPGPDYLYLFALRATANIKLIGRVDAENWQWALVENTVPCWVNIKYLDVEGDFLSLPVVYPDGVKLPVTPYYPRSEVLSAERKPDTHEISISWLDVPISAGDYESERMQTYIVELWRCEAGQLIFDPVATRLTYLTFVDEPGCSQPSHGRVFVQEKHGYAGPAEIPWPE